MSSVSSLGEADAFSPCVCRQNDWQADRLNWFSTSISAASAPSCWMMYRLHVNFLPMTQQYFMWPDCTQTDRRSIIFWCYDQLSMSIGTTKFNLSSYATSRICTSRGQTRPILFPDWNRRPRTVRELLCSACSSCNELYLSSSTHYLSVKYNITLQLRCINSHRLFHIS